MYKMSEKPLIRADEIRERVATLAREIVDVYDYDILLSALTGAYMFTADLNRELAKAQGAKAYNKAIAFIKASSYGNSTTSSGKLQVRGLEKIFVGFEIANEFVVGYGLDYAENYRSLSEIWTLQETD